MSGRELTIVLGEGPDNFFWDSYFEALLDLAILA